jgi:polysaccharide chain length determinant protein (PEP-CTERM system associated)
MKEIVEKVYEEARSAWRFRWVGLALAALIAIVGWTVVFALPDRYEATASVFVDTRTALRPLLQGLTVEQDVNVQLNYARQSLLAGERLERIARKSGVLAPEESDPKKIAYQLDEFVSRVVIDVRSANIRESEREAGSVYNFRYRDPSRDRSLLVTQILVDTFVEETLGAKRAATENAQQFAETELRDLEARLSAAENRLADFKKANVGLMPTEQGGYFTLLQTEIDSARRIENEINVAQSRRAELARQLRGESVVAATAVSPTGTGGGSDTVSRINETQARLDELLLRFTDKHPSVEATRATLEELKARRANEIEQLRRGDPNAVAASGVSSNPTYQLIQQQLNQVDVEIASLRGQLAQHRQKAADLRARLDEAPKVEAEFLQLNRDYDIVRAQYSALLENYEKAQLGERADDAGSVRFEIVQPASASYSPVSPKRTLMLTAILVVALGAGGALTYVLHLMKPVVGSAQGLADLTDLPVLGVVSAAFPAQLAAKARGELLRFVGAGSALGAAFAVVMVLNWLGVRLTGAGS